MLLTDNRIVEDLLHPLKLRLLNHLRTGGVLTERRLAQYVGTSHVTVGKFLKEFAQRHLATQKQVGRANLWTLNTDSYLYRAMTPTLEALQKIAAPISVLIETIKKHLPHRLIQEGILFGSVVTGEERDDSDIDLCLILKQGVSKDNETLTTPLDSAVEECYRLFGKRLSPYLMTSSDWTRKKNSALGKAIQAGKKVYP